MSANVAILLYKRIDSSVFSTWCGDELNKSKDNSSFSQSDQGIVGGETWFLDV